MKKILAALDFSDITGAVVDAAASLADVYAAELTLVHVAAPDPEFVGYEPGPDTVRDTRAKQLRGEHRELQAHAEALRARGIDARALLIQGPTVATLLEETRRIGADALVLGSHGHGALHRALLGSVSEGVVRGARLPVLLVPDPRKSDEDAGRS